MLIVRSNLCSMLAAVLFTACVSMPDASSARASIERNNSSIERSYASGDVDGVASMFAADAWQMPPNNAPLAGREAIRAFWKQAFGWGKWQFSLQTQDVQASGPVAVERGRYVLTFTAGPGAPPGMASFTDRGNYVVYWRRESNGEWRGVWDAPVSEIAAGPSK